MKLNTSKMLAQLSEQERNKVEIELAALNTLKQQFMHQQQSCISRIQQLNQQRNQSIKQRNAAALLQAFDLSLHEQQSMITLIQEELNNIEQQQQLVLKKFSAVFRKHHSCEKMHLSNERQQRRKSEQKQQRQLDDIFAARHPAAAS